MVKIKQDIKANLTANLKRLGVSLPEEIADKIYKALPRRLQVIDNRGGFFASKIKNHPPRFRSKSTEYALFLVKLLLTFPKKSVEESIKAAENCFNWTYKEYVTNGGTTYQLKTGKEIFELDKKYSGGGVIFFNDYDGTTQTVNGDSIYIVKIDDFSIYSIE